VKRMLNEAMEYTKLFTAQFVNVFGSHKH